MEFIKEFAKSNRPTGEILKWHMIVTLLYHVAMGEDLWMAVKRSVTSVGPDYFHTTHIFIKHTF